MPVRQEAVEEVYEEQTPAPRVRATPTSSRRMAPAVQGEVVEQVGDPEQADWVQPNGDYYGGGFGEGCYGGNCGGCGGGCGSFGACDGCGGYFNGFCNHGCLGNFYGDIDYLMWWTKGMDTPPLVVQVNNGQGDVIYGNDPLLTGLRNGGRVRLGKWFDCCQTTAIEGDYQFLDTIKDTFTAASTGIPQIGRPFIDANTGAQFIEEVATAGRLAGSVRVDSQGQYRSAGIRLRRQLCCEPICYTDWHTGCQMQGNARISGQLATQDTRLGELDKTSREALDRATAAGKLAEGKFLYSMVLSDDSVKFPVESAALSEEAQTRLMAFAQKLTSENRNVYLEIQGHTDATGTKAINERLGQERAEAVRRFMNKQGVALNRMATISYGDEAPVASNKDRAGRAQNRRVVVVVLS